jgi:hypothetical protein
MPIVRFESSYVEPYPLWVQGESYYKENIETVSNYTGEDEGVNADDFIARLILENNNPYDPGNAVRIDIDGKTVGHLSKPNAKKYRKRLLALELFDVIGECYASIKGGFALRDGGMADFGVRLDLDLETFKIYIPPAKPSPPVAPITPPTPIIENKTEQSSPPPVPSKSALKKFLDWFFAPSKYRRIRMILFFLMVLLLCGMYQSVLQFITGNP